MSLILRCDPLTYIISFHRPGWRDWTGVMLDGWRTAQSSTPSLIPATSAAARTTPLVFVTMATGTRRTSAMMLSVSPPSWMVRTREIRRSAAAGVCTCMCISDGQEHFLFMIVHLKTNTQPQHRASGAPDWKTTRHPTELGRSDTV